GQELLNGAVEARIREPVPGPRRGRREAAADLVLALNAGLELREPLANAVLDPLVIAGFEVQAVEIGETAPVAAVERADGVEADRGGDRRPLVPSEDHEHVLRHRPRDLGEQLAVEIGFAAAEQKRARVEGEDQVPVLGRQLVAAHVLEANPRLGDPAPLAARLLALLGAERREELVEIAVAAVVPDELAALARQESGRLERRPLRLRRKKAV